MKQTKQETAPAPRSGIGKALTFFLCTAILLAAVGMTVLIFTSEPEAIRSGATRKSAMPVEVTHGQHGTFRPTVIAMGVVKPAQDIILSSRVSGEVIELSKDFVPGGVVKKGATLLRLDPADYETDLKQKQSDLRQALSELDLEMGRQQVAKQDYQLLEENLVRENKELVLRRPQLNSAQAKVEAARAAVRQAELALERTTIQAMFDAHILNTEVHIGSQVSPGENLAHLVGVDTYWVEATVPLATLRYLTFPEETGKQGSTVHIRNRTAWARDDFRIGHLSRLIGALEDQTRLARVLITVTDPLARQTHSHHLPRLMIGSFVEAQIEAREIEDVVRLQRDYLRNNDTVWLMLNDKLVIRPVQVIFSDATYAYTKSGLAENEPVVTTNLSTVVEGAGLRLKETNEE